MATIMPPDREREHWLAWIDGRSQPGERRRTVEIGKAVLEGRLGVECRTL
jgi:hypothetical protein